MMPVMGIKGKMDEEEVQQKEQNHQKKKKKKAPDIKDRYKEKEIRSKRAAQKMWKAYSHTTQEVEWRSHCGKWVVIIITDIYKTDVLKEQGRKRQKKKRKG